MAPIILPPEVIGQVIEATDRSGSVYRYAYVRDAEATVALARLARVSRSAHAWAIPLLYARVALCTTKQLADFMAALGDAISPNSRFQHVHALYIDREEISSISTDWAYTIITTLAPALRRLSINPALTTSTPPQATDILGDPSRRALLTEFATTQWYLFVLWTAGKPEVRPLWASLRRLALYDIDLAEVLPCLSSFPQLEHLVFVISAASTIEPLPPVGAYTKIVLPRSLRRILFVAGRVPKYIVYLREWERVFGTIVSRLDIDLSIRFHILSFIVPRGELIRFTRYRRWMERAIKSGVIWELDGLPSDRLELAATDKNSTVGGNASRMQPLRLRMAPIILPPEVIGQIIEVIDRSGEFVCRYAYVRDAEATVALARLARVSRSTHAWAVPLLYARVALHTKKQLFSFVDALDHDDASRFRHVRALYITQSLNIRVMPVSWARSIIMTLAPTLRRLSINPLLSHLPTSIDILDPSWCESLTEFASMQILPFALWTREPESWPSWVSLRRLALYRVKFSAVLPRLPSFPQLETLVLVGGSIRSLLGPLPSVESTATVAFPRSLRRTLLAIGRAHDYVSSPRDWELIFRTIASRLQIDTRIQFRTLPVDPQSTPYDRWMEDAIGSGEIWELDGLSADELELDGTDIPNSVQGGIAGS
ncbi:hypothetical protein BOTBODRAFT_622331 [Botryobasidium botryosum FD-172 SS1]|uniref:Uncharacterized protein n=1 Tax=Botryobasidium botryosum (strain FD-172 SS1) TaxID=930990 RepID=A0A067MYE3_BOTB1|nr:hypothetical protein BOTBODRAFT_622331 [Botryobasidium botryosum FD-172 SS1]